MKNVKEEIFVDYRETTNVKASEKLSNIIGGEIWYE